MLKNESKQFKKVYQFKIELGEISPKIWRRIQVPENYNFFDLHCAIQDAFGWCNYHMHEFELIFPKTGRKERVGMIDDEEGFYSSSELFNENNEKISKWFSVELKKADYTYDFGDGWRHKITLEKVLEKSEKIKYPICIDGARACPPEDCGGTGGYEDLLEIIKDPKHAEYKGMIEWLGDKFDPEEFDPEKVDFVKPKDHADMLF